MNNNRDELRQAISEELVEGNAATEAVNECEPDATETCRNAENTVVNTYKKIEGGVAGGYKKIEEGVVGGYRKIEQSADPAVPDSASKKAGNSSAAVEILPLLRLADPADASDDHRHRIPDGQLEPGRRIRRNYDHRNRRIRLL